MNVLALLKAPYGTKLWSFGLPWLGIILFVLFYVPANQKSAILKSAESEVTTLSEMLAFSVSEGLSEQNFALIQTAFDWSKRDSNIIFVSILDEQDSVIFEYNPHQRQVDRSKLRNQPGVVAGDEVVLAVSQILGANQSGYSGSIILMRSLEAANVRIRIERIISILVTLLMCGVGLWGLLTMARQTKALSSEVEERKRIEETLAADRALLRTLVDNIPDRIYVKDTESRFLLNNVAHMNALGAKSIDEVIGKSDADFRPGEMAMRSFADDQEVVRSGKALINREEQTYLPTGEAGWLLTSKVPLRDQHGTTIGIVGISRDITNRKQAEKDLQESNEKFNQLAGSITDVFWIRSPDMRKLHYLSPSYEKIWGRSVESLLAHPEQWIDFALTEDRERVHDAFAVFATGATDLDIEYRIMRPDNEIRWVHTRGFQVRDNAGRVVRLTGVVTDITGRKKVEEALRESQQIIEGIINTIPVRVFWKDKNLNYLGCNAVFAHDAGFADPKDIIGKSDYQLGWRDVADLYRAGDRQTIESGCSNSNVEELQTTPEGNIITILTSKMPLRTSNGEITGILGTYVDITERKQAEEALRRSEEQFSNAFELAPIGIAIVAIDGHWLKVNRSVTELLGYNEAELLTKTFQDVTHPDDLKSDLENLHRLLAGDIRFYQMEKRYFNKRGNVIEVLLNVSCVRDEWGKPLHYIAQIQDITERKLAENQLKLLAHTVASVSDSISIADLDDKLIFVNKSFCEVYGYAEEEILGKNVSALRAASSQLELGEQIFRETLAGSWHGEVVNRRKDGAEFPIELWTSIVKDESGHGVATVGVCRDITERKHRDDEIRKLSEAVEQSPVSIVITDIRGTIEYVNPKFVEVTGYSSEEAIGKNTRILKSGNMSTELYSHLWAKITTGNKWHGELHNKKKNGELYWEQVSISPIIDLNGNILHFLAVKEDITERKHAEELLRQQSQSLEDANIHLLESKLKAEEHTRLLNIKAWELIAAREVALEASRLKSEFVANMSHEIRTPMNGIIGMTSLLLDTNLSPEQREFAEIVRKSGDALLTVVNDILDFSKIEAGKTSLEIVDLDLISVVEGTVELLALRAQEKGLELGCLIDRESLRALCGDPGRVRQVLTNLVGNAIKFTEKGEVTVGALIEEETASTVTVRFTVTDTGIGISDENKKRLFQAFSQADGSTTRNYGGTGLGLAISKQLVELMGGTIGVDSEPGKGSTFWWIATFERRPSTSIFLPSRAGLAGLRCLIVDDNMTNRRILHHYITSWGMSNGSAENGPRGLEVLRAAASKGEPYDVAILDMQMPEMDGMQLARSIKADHRLADIRLILLTSICNQNTLSLKEAGFSAGLAKPVKQSQLFDCIANVMTDTLEVTDEQRPGAKVYADSVAHVGVMNTNTVAEPRKGLRILVAEDNAVNQKVAVRMLEKLGYRPGVAGNGVEALAAVSQASYDIVFMDCQMPEMDGFEATSQIRTLDGTEKHTTIIAMTANALQGDRERCLDAGMDDYVSKPIRQDDLAAAIDRWSLEKHKEDAPFQKAPKTDQLLDESVLQELTELSHADDADLVEQLLSMFLNETPPRMEYLRNSLRRQDPRSLRETAHLIKGTCKQLGLLAMVNLCQILEDCAESLAPDMCDEAIAQLEQTFFETGALLRSKYSLQEVKP